MEKSVMTPSEQKIEQYHAIVGDDTSYRFEHKIAQAVQELAESLENNFMDDEAKVDYATHVFAKMLDDLADFLENPRLIN
jgi:hypothetical protein